MPIEVRIGRRLLRTIPAESNEGQRLLGSNRVEIVTVKSRPLQRPAAALASASAAPVVPAAAAARSVPARRTKPVSRDH